MKLKNLEELNIPEKYKKILKKEASKWIQQLRKVVTTGNIKDMPECNIPFEHIENWRGHLMSQITWIKHFFNITEEDLK